MRIMLRPYSGTAQRNSARELRERAVRLAAEHRGENETVAIRSIAANLSIATAASLRKGRRENTSRSCPLPGQRREQRQLG
jgi:transposase-like protein